MDNPSNAFLARYLAGECSVEEANALARWVAEDRAREAQLRGLRALWQARRAPSAWDVSGMWSVVQRSVQEDRRVSIVRGPSRRRPLLRYATGYRRVGLAAAAVAITVLGVVAVQFFQGRATSRSGSGMAAVPMREYATTRGQRTTLLLPDGSHLVLAPASRLRIPAAFGRTSRDVFLEGEAFFDVVHDTTRPFRVMAKDAIAQDLGTRFNVRAYPEDTVIGVAVQAGAVALGLADVPVAGAPQSVVLREGELGTLAPTGRVAVTRGAIVTEQLAWMEGKLVLVDISLGDAVIRLGRWYDIDITLAPALSTKRVTAAFEGESAIEALQFIALFLDLTVTHEENRYALRSK